MRASRLLSIMMLLQTRGRMSAEALAGALEVSVRTIYRDVDQLSAAGVPIYAEIGRAGGFELLDGWKTKLTGLTSHEAQALFLAGMPGPAAELGLGEAMAAAQLKLLAALPQGWQDEAQKVGSRVHLDPQDWFAARTANPFLSAVAGAVWSEKRLQLRYRSWKGDVDRRVDPLGLVLKGGDWYLVARATEGGRFPDMPRTYRLDSILALEALDERFIRPRQFDLASFWAAAAARFERDIYQDTARLRVTASGLERLARLSPAVAGAVEGRTVEADGFAEVTIPIETVAHAARELLRVGAEAEVLAPPDLRRALAETAHRLAALYVRESA